MTGAVIEHDCVAVRVNGEAGGRGRYTDLTAGLRGAITLTTRGGEQAHCKPCEPRSRQPGQPGWNFHNTS
jgi:hypothetical protein